MRHEDLRIFLEMGGDGDGRDVVLHRQEIADHVAAHEEFDLAGDQEHAAVRRRAALQNGDVEAVFGVSSVDERLVVAAGLRVGDPIGAKGHLVEGRRRSGEPDRPRQRRDHRNAHNVSLPRSHSLDGSAAAPPSAVGLALRPNHAHVHGRSRPGRSTIRAEISSVEYIFRQPTRA